MARHNVSALSRAAKLRAEIHDFAAGIERKYGTSALSNPAGRTIEARKRGTCKISGGRINVGDSITETDEGWALTEHVGAAMENPRQFQKGRGEFVKTPESVREHNRYYDMFEQTYFEGGPGEHAEFLAYSKKPAAKFQQVEGSATPSSGLSVSSLIRKAGDLDLFGVPRGLTKVDFHSDAGHNGMGGAYIGSVSINGDIVTFVGFEPPGKSFAVKILNPRKATAAIVDVVDALNAGYENLAATVAEFADGVLQLVGESGRSNPYYRNSSMGGRS